MAAALAAGAAIYTPPLLAVRRRIACGFRAVVIGSAQTALQIHLLPFYTVRPSQDHPERTQLSARRA